MSESLNIAAQSTSFFTGFKLNDLWFLAEAAGHTLLIAALAISIGTLFGIFFGWLLSVSRWAGPPPWGWCWTCSARCR